MRRHEAAAAACAPESPGTVAANKAAVSAKETRKPKAPSSDATAGSR